MSHKSEENGNSRKGNGMHYCDQAEENGPNRKLIYSLMADITCVLEKSFGENEVLQSKRESFESDVGKLHEKLHRYQGMRDELDMKIQDLVRDNHELHVCFEEQCKVRCDLENCIAQLKEQIQRQDELIACLNAEKVDLLGWAKELETHTVTHKHQVLGLHNHREGLTRGVQGFEMTRTRCVDLQRALAECCERCDALLQENRELIQTTKELDQNLTVVGSEKSGLLTELDHIRKLIQEEKDQLKGQICHLLEQQATFNQQKSDICRKLNEAISAHHVELDRLKTEADMYHDQLEKEMRDKEDFSRRLIEGDKGVPIGSDATGTGPCAELERQLAVANEKIEKFQKLYDTEASERKKLDKQLMGLVKENTKLEARANVVERKKPKGKLTPVGGISSPPPRSPKTSIDRGTIPDPMRSNGTTQSATKDMPPPQVKMETGSPPETETILGRRSNTQHSHNPGLLLPIMKALESGENNQSTESVLTGEAPWGRRWAAAKGHDDHSHTSVHFTGRAEKDASTSKDDFQSKVKRVSKSEERQRRGSKEVDEEVEENWHSDREGHEGHDPYNWVGRKSEDLAKVIALRDALAKKSKAPHPHHLQ